MVTQFDWLRDATGDAQYPAGGDGDDVRCAQHLPCMAIMAAAPPWPWPKTTNSPGVVWLTKGKTSALALAKNVDSVESSDAAEVTVLFCEHPGPALVQV